MAPGQRSRHNAEQRLARQFFKRGDSASPSPPPSTPVVPTETTTPSPSNESKTTLSASSSFSDSSPPGVTLPLPPHGVAALVGIVVMLSLAVLGFVAWRVWVYRRKKKVAQTAHSEKSSKSVGLFDAVDDDPSMKRTLSVETIDTIAFPPKAGNKVVMTRESMAAKVRFNLTYQPKVVYAAPKEKTNCASTSPGINVTGLQTMPPPVYVAVPPPALSPRTLASMAPRASIVSTASKLPRLVVVESTFTPSLDDELEVREGETLQLLEEYEDEWCLVQRVGSKAAETGFIPQFCIIDIRNPPPEGSHPAPQPYW